MSPAHCPDEDIYALIPPVHPFFSLRHRSHRRNALLAVAALYVYVLSSHSPPLKPTYYPHALRGDVPVDHDTTPGNVTQSNEQRLSETRLNALVASKQSAYDPSHWWQFRVPPYSAVRRRPRLYAEDASTSRQEARYAPVTAVVLHWKRPKGLRLVVKHIAKYPFIREIIVWNNNVDVHLAPSDLLSLLPTTYKPHVRVVNSPANVHDLGKHTACSMATYETCYFNDDDWLNIYMDSLYTKYIDSGGQQNHRIVSNTMPIIHLEHRRWQFHNHDIDLHTGFTWLGTGALVPRSLSTRFVNQISAFSENPLSPEQVSLGDMYFSIWANAWPDQMSNTLISIDIEGDEVGWSRSKGVDQWNVVYTNLLDAIRRLSSVLSQRDPHLSPFPFHRVPPNPTSNLRSPCINDQCLFLTSFNPFPSPSNLNYPNPKLKKTRSTWFGKSHVITTPPPLQHHRNRFDPFQIDHMKEHELLFNQWKGVDGKEWPQEDWWVKRGSWHFAVNGNKNECWHSGTRPGKGDYFGLRFVRSRRITRITLLGSLGILGIGNLEDEDSVWNVQTITSTTSNVWVTRRIRGEAQIESTSSGSYFEVTIQLVPISTIDDFNEGDEGVELVESIRLISKRQGSDALHLCGWKLDEFEI